MSLANIVSGDYGQVIRLTVLDTDTNTAANISAYATAQFMTFKDPDGTESVKVAAFFVAGADGIVQYTLVSGDINQPGVWQVRIVVTAAAAQLSSTWLSFVVLA